MLDGAPIVVIATGVKGKGSKNEKTGAMVQTWIIRADVDPVTASRLGLDRAVCGTCPHMGKADPAKETGWSRDRACYVNLGQAPLNVYKTYRAGKYNHVSPEVFATMVAGRMLRLGSYGDPGAVPLAIFEPACRTADGVNGYTHAWRDRPDLAQWCMASADSETDRVEASAAGFRVFRVRPETAPVLPREVICPASKEAGQRTVCAACKACGGHSAKAKADIVIIDHGPQRKKRIEFRRKAAA